MGIAALAPIGWEEAAAGLFDFLSQVMTFKPAKPDPAWTGIYIGNAQAAFQLGDVMQLHNSVATLDTFSDLVIHAEHADPLAGNDLAAEFFRNAVATGAPFVQFGPGWNFALMMGFDASEELTPQSTGGVAMGFQGMISELEANVYGSVHDLGLKLQTLANAVAQLEGIDLDAIIELVGTPETSVAEDLLKASTLQSGDGAGAYIGAALAGLVRMVDGTAHNALSDLFQTVNGSVYGVGNLLQTGLYYDTGNNLRNSLLTMRSLKARRDVEYP